MLVIGSEPLDDAPIIDLWIRKGVRRRGVKLALATARPSALDVNAEQVVRFAPGGEAEFLSGLADELSGRAAPGDLARLLRDEGGDVVVVWGERIGAEAALALLRLAQTLGLGEREGAGLLELPVGANGRGLREVGVLPNAGPGYRDAPASGRNARQIAQAAAEGEIGALYLFQVDPVRELAERKLWERALQRAGLVVAHASVLTEGLREHAAVIFPAESHAEKEGTVTHPDGRVQRLRAAIAHPDEVRPGWSILADLAKRVGYDLGVLTSPMAFGQLSRSVPFYRGLTLEDIGGRGLRWPARAQADSLPGGEAPRAESSPSATSTEQASSNGALRLGTYRPIWAAPEVEISPALRFAIAQQQLELSPEDAQRLQIASGQEVDVAQLDDSGAAHLSEAGGRARGKPEGTRIRAKVHVRSGVPAGTVFLADGIATNSANALTGEAVEVRKT